MNANVPNNIVRGAHILEELSYKYRYRVQEIAGYLCKYLPDKATSNNGEEIQTADYVIEILKIIVALPRTDLSDHPLLIDLNRLRIVGATLTNLNFKTGTFMGI